MLIGGDSMAGLGHLGSLCCINNMQVGWIGWRQSMELMK